MVNCSGCINPIDNGQEFVCPAHIPKAMQAYHANESCYSGFNPLMRVYVMTPARAEVLQENS